MRDALCEQYRKIHFNYLIRLNRKVMDNVIDIIPFFLAEIIRYLIQMKLINHEIPLQQNRTFILLISSIMREFYGFQVSESTIDAQKRVFIKSLAARINCDSSLRPQQASPEIKKPSPF